MTTPRRLDLSLILMTAGFAVAIGALAWPAFQTAPTSTPHMILMVAVAAVCVG